MNIGKLDSSKLKSLLDKYTGFKRDDIPSLARVGEDCSFVRLGNKTLVLTTDPVTAAKSKIGTIGFNINMNDIATSGAEGIGLMVTLLLPPDTSFDKIEEVMSELHEEACKNKMQILGGHTEVTDSVNRIILSITAIGLTNSGEEIRSGNANIGDYLVVSKVLGIEGTLILANDFKERLKDILTTEELDRALAMENSLSVVIEGNVGKLAGVNAMHDITEGGIKGAVWEMAEASSNGCDLYIDDLPFDEVTLKISKEFNIDPLKLISSGSMLFSTSKPDDLILKLNESGIPGTVIGKITEKDRRVITNNKALNLEPPSRDEIYGVFK